MAWDHRNKFQEDEPLDEAQPGAKVPKATPTHRGTKTFTCPGCEARTYGDMAYCPDCGYKLSRKCPNCGAQWRYEYSSAFCPGCGTQLQPRKEPAGQGSHQEKASVSPQTGDKS
jgi:predicted amidophosphoribosyltransferase